MTRNARGGYESSGRTVDDLRPPPGRIETAQFYPCCEHCDGLIQHSGVTRLDRHKVACDEPACPGGLLLTTPPAGSEADRG